MKIRILLAVIFLGFAYIGIAQCQQFEIFDRYPASIPANIEAERLSNFSAFLKKEPTYIGYIVYYVGPDLNESATRRRALRAKRYLVRKRKINASRVIVAKGGTMPETLFILQPASKQAPPLNLKRVGSEKPGRPGEREFTELGEAKSTWKHESNSIRIR